MCNKQIDGGNLPLISVVVPVYNVEKYLDKCLASICGQTYGNLEIILVDDGSRDSSGDICDRWASSDKRIKVLHTANGGLSAARNKGLDIATGSLVGFVDSDDYIDEDMYEFLYGLMRDYDTDISVCGNYFEEKGRNRNLRVLHSPCTYDREQSLRLLIQDKLLRNYVWDKLYKRELFDGLRFEKGVIFEDIKFMFEVISRMDRIVIFDKFKYHYVQRPGSIINTKYKFDVNQAYFVAVYEQLSYLIAQGHGYAVSTMMRRCLHATKRLTLTDGTDGRVRENLAILKPYLSMGCFKVGLMNVYKYWVLDKHLQFYKRLYRLSKGRLSGI